MRSHHIINKQQKQCQVQTAATMLAGQPQTNQTNQTCRITQAHVLISPLSASCPTLLTPHPPPFFSPLSLSFLSGAGLLLWDANCNTLVLGRDFKREWSDFGGRRDQTDRDAWCTASREAAEESLGVLNGSIVNEQGVIAEVRHIISMLLVVVAILQMLVSKRTAETKFKRLQVRARSYVCYLIDTTGTRICK
jgi:hypothetical protein